MNDPRGSIWRKWDLHVHTPASIIQNYGRNEDEEVWNDFFKDLESLPSEFKVIGINDYIFIDGYKKVIEAKKNGRLSNINLILPVIELRLDKFGGTNSALSRINLHIIFSDEITPDIIQQQFLNALPRYYQLTPQYSDLRSEWMALATRESLEELGQKIIESVPEERRCQYDSPLKEGFNNLNFSLDHILECLRVHYFKDNYLIAVGKTEWADVKWTDQSIADKKNIINQADIVFISAETIADFRRSKESLTSSQVNDILLDCSDAHYFSNVPGKDRIGKCFSWIKADTTFEGLKQTLIEPDERIFVGDLPDKLHTVASNKTKYIHSLKIYPKSGSTLDEVWFRNEEILFSHDLIAIIGNKGNGKSALTDIIALLGDSHSSEFSFLNRNKFCSPRDNKAQHFAAMLIWESEQSVDRPLTYKVPEDAVEKTKYIPQLFFDKICNEIEIGEGSNFDKELKDVIFSHIDNANRLGCDSLDELARYRTQEIEERIQILRLELQEINQEISELEKQVSVKSCQILEKQISDKEQELKVHEANLPKEEEKPSSDSNTNQIIETKKKQIQEISLAIEEANRNLKLQRSKFAAIIKLRDKIDNFNKQFAILRSDCLEQLELLEINLSDIIEVRINRIPLDEKYTQISGIVEQLESQLDSQRDNSLLSRRNKIEREIDALREQLDEANKKYQIYLRNIELWKRRKAGIIGDMETPDSLEYYKYKLNESRTILPANLEQEKRKRFLKTLEIYREIQKIAKVYKELYSHIQRATDRQVLVDKGKYGIDFKVTIRESHFQEKFFSFIDQRIRGAFCGRGNEGNKRLRDIIDKYDFNRKTQIIRFIKEIIAKLEKRQENEEDSHCVESQLKAGAKSEELYNLLFSLEYIEPIYALQLNGKDLQQLSPGERGVLLLIFYLLVDKADYPLIIDQPEENLDSESVVELLVPSIKAAKQRRQIFVVTHNPNLAVVCNADQIIHAFIDKGEKNRVHYTSGAIENPDINKKIVDVLEGTWRAFGNRNLKYIRPKQYISKLR